ncbi:MAG: NAD(+)/NADH kinase [Syntrophomonadaceae bacterium]|nr:NAD(+)/NADH kinase [Syntrophomonadaceae bacterium]
MMKIGIIMNGSNRMDVLSGSNFIAQKFREQNIEVWLDSSPEYNPADSDLLMVLGGDGTLLKSFHKYGEMGIPFLGVNFGNIGFLSLIEPDDFIKYLPAIVKKEFEIGERNVLQVSLCREKQDVVISSYAFNDIVVKAVIPKISRQILNIDGNFFSKYEGDGIICATSTGSTAYSLSAGGSIIDPRLAAAIITPICARANMMNSIVISAEHHIEILCNDIYPCSIFAVDGNEPVRLINRDLIKIKKSSLKIKLVQFDQDRYFNLLQSKLLRVR